MILQALCELAEAEGLMGDPDFQYKPISWVIRLHDDGSFLQFEDNRRNSNEAKTTRMGKPLKANWVGRDEIVPVQPTRTSGDSAFFLVDKAEYVLGVDPGGKRPRAKLNTRSKLFREQVQQCADATPDPSVSVVATFLRSLSGDHSRVQVPEEVAANDLFGFKVGNAGFVHLQPSVKAWWKQRRSVKARVSRYRCLITGEPIAEVELFPQIKRVPGGTPSGVALVSHNLRAFESYGLAGNDNAPVSRDASQAAAAALNRLLHREPDKAFGRPELKVRHIRLGSDTAVVYWSPHGDPEALDVILGLTDAESAEAVAEAYRSVWSGKPPSIDDASRFYAMTLTGTQGRVIVRDWLETTVAEMMHHLALHFEHLAVVRNTAPPRGTSQTPFISLRQMMEALAAPGRDAEVSRNISAQFVRAALSGTKYPLSMLQRALIRERAEAGGDEWIDSARRDARASLVKSVLIRHYQREVPYEMNANETNSGYLLGRLLAVLEDMQRHALGRRNATIVDKYYGAASAMPAAVFPTLMSLYRKHARKAKDARPGAVVNREREIDVILEKLKHVPRHLDLADQGMFVLGYHHQRHALMNRQWSFAQVEEEPAEPPEDAAELELAL